MIVDNTPVEHYPDLGLYAKREDLSCPPPGPPFSKTRGVFAHIKNRPEKVIGVLDSAHSQAGHAVATACRLLGKTCVNYYPKFKTDTGIRPQQQASLDLGAKLVPLKATASWALHHVARKDLEACWEDSYLMPNALKLPETVSETAAEVGRTAFPVGIDTLLVAVSSGTIASGVIRGIIDHKVPIDTVVLHLGYNRPARSLISYIEKASARDLSSLKLIVINEGYEYRDKVEDVQSPFPCNPYYDRKLLSWWLRPGDGRTEFGEALLWNVG